MAVKEGKCVYGFVFENNLIGRNLFLLWQGNAYVVGEHHGTPKYEQGSPLLYSFESHHHNCASVCSE